MKWQMPISYLLANACVWLDTAHCDVTRSTDISLIPLCLFPLRGTSSWPSCFRWGQIRKVWQSTERNIVALNSLFSKGPYIMNILFSPRLLAVLLLATCCILYIAPLNLSNLRKCHKPDQMQYSGAVEFLSMHPIPQSSFPCIALHFALATTISGQLVYSIFFTWPAEHLRAG